jgi:hypothetical protein
MDSPRGACALALVRRRISMALPERLGGLASGPQREPR